MEMSLTGGVVSTVHFPEDLVFQTLTGLGTCLVTIDELGTILSASNLGFAAERFALLAEETPEPVSNIDAMGKSIADIWPLQVANLVALACARALGNEGVQSFEHTLHDTNRNPVYLSVKALSELRNDGQAIHLTLTDLTIERMRERQMAVFSDNLEEANLRLRLALSGSKVSVFEQDLDLRYTFMANAPEFLENGGIGRTDLELFGLEVGGRLTDIKFAVLEGKPSWSGRVVVPTETGETVEFDVELEPRMSSHGDVIGLIGTAIDLSDLKRHEDAMRLAMREITHRTKNLLAVIQATARRSAAKSESVEAFIDSFSKRLEAMSHSHDLLVSSDWRGADMATLIRRQGDQAGGIREGAFKVEGPKLTLTSEAAQHFGMALHELVSNALKYGALSSSSGEVAARWYAADGDDADIVFEWIESGGPAVAQPSRSGFGTSYLQRAVAMALNGTTELDFDQAGLRCRIKMPGACFQ
jgi:two-component sensor histidine kinase